MSKTLSNLLRKAEKYGDVHFISFLGAILSRLSYMNDYDFYMRYQKIMGPVIAPNLLTAIDKVPATNLNALLDDQTLFALTPNSPLYASTYDYKGKKYLDVLKMNIPQNVNIINGDLDGMVQGGLNQGQPPLAETVKYISIGWSNYGEVYVVADKRMPQTIFLIFRGTYSAKTAGLYTKASSLMPLTVCQGETFLYGIFKPTAEMIHTVVETIRYLAVNFLQATEEKPVKIFTTGHSLGGAMCSIFAYLWTTTVKETPVYREAPYKVLAKNIVCVSLGAPRCFGKQAAKKFCDLAMSGVILYLRIVTKGDTVTAVPPKSFGFDHPCSDDLVKRKRVVEECNATLTFRPTLRSPIPSLNISYDSPLDCLDETMRLYMTNPLSHTVYLDIMFSKAVDMKKFAKGIAFSQEVLRAKDVSSSTVCRLVEGFNNNFKAVFFNVNQAREVPSTLDAEIEKVESTEKGLDVSGSTPAATPPAATTPAPSPVQQKGGLIWPFSGTPTAKPTSPPTTATTATGVPNKAPTSTATIVNKATSTPLATGTPTPTATKPAPSSNLFSRFRSSISTTPVTSTNQPSTTPAQVAPKTSMLPSLTKLPSGKLGGPVAEDVRMTREAFDFLIQNMTPISISSKVPAPLTGTIVNPFIVGNQKPQLMPKLDCLQNQTSVAPVAVAPASTVPATTTPKGGKHGRKTHRRGRSQRTHCNKRRRSCYRRKKKSSRYTRRSASKR
jgi:hypothetical protein